jgi:hypothetical protein
MDGTVGGPNMISPGLETDDFDAALSRIASLGGRVLSKGRW